MAGTHSRSVYRTGVIIMNGLMYSLAVTSADPDGFGITAVDGAICAQASEAQ